MQKKKKIRKKDRWDFYLTFKCHLRSTLTVQLDFSMYDFLLMMNSHHMPKYVPHWSFVFIHC